MNTVIEKSLLKELIEMAEDGYILHKRNGCHQEFLSEDRDNIKKAKEIYASQSEQGYSEAFWTELRDRFFKECVDRLLVWPRQFDYSKESNATIIFEWFKSSLNQKQLKGLRSGDWYLNEYGNKITILSVADDWCMVREGDKKPFVVPEEFVLGTFDKAK